MGTRNLVRIHNEGLWELSIVSNSSGTMHGSDLLLSAHLGGKVAEEKPGQDGQRHEDHLGHADLPEIDPEDDLLGVLDQDDDKQDEQDGGDQDFRFHHIHLFRLKYITITRPIASILPTMTKYPQRHSSSGMNLKFIP